MAAWRPGWIALVVLLVAVALPASAPAPAEALTPTVTRTPTRTRTPTPTPRASAGPSQSILGRRFLPRTMRVVVGATVRWTNSDRVEHTVTSSAGLFDSGVLAQRSVPRTPVTGPAPSTGGAFAYRFAATGKYAYYCAIHAGMIGTIQVVPPAPPTPVRARLGAVRS